MTLSLNPESTLSPLFPNCEKHGSSTWIRCIVCRVATRAKKSQIFGGQELTLAAHHARDGADFNFAHKLVLYTSELCNAWVETTKNSCILWLRVLDPYTHTLTNICVRVCVCLSCVCVWVCVHVSGISAEFHSQGRNFSLSNIFLSDGRTDLFECFFCQFVFFTWDFSILEF